MGIPKLHKANNDDHLIFFFGEITDEA